MHPLGPLVGIGSLWGYASRNFGLQLGHTILEAANELQRLGVLAVDEGDRVARRLRYARSFRGKSSSACGA